MATLQSLEAERARLLAERDILSAKYQAGDTSVLVQIQEINAQLRNVVVQIEALSTPIGQTAAGEIVSNAPLGDTQNPPPPATSTGRLTNDQAATLAQNTEYGTNPPVKTLTETQSVNNTRGLPVYNEEGTLATSRRNPETGELYTPLNAEGRPGGEPGVGATGR
jgi:hypothetical protein